MNGVVAFFEDRLAGPGETAAWLFGDCREELVADATPAGAAAFLAAVEAAQDAGHWVVLALAYEFAHLLEAATHPTRPLPPVTARAWVCASAQTLAADAADAWLAGELAALPDERRRVGVGGLHAEIDLGAYTAAIARIRDYIAAGDCYQVNYTFPLRGEAWGDPLALYAALRQRQPARYGGFLRAGDGSTLLSLSPELFVARHGSRLTVRPMKGTSARAADPAADAAAVAELAACAKNRAENLMIVDLLRNDLGRVARPGSVVVEQLFAVESYPSLHQMVSQVAAEAPGVRLGELLRALFPCGSITGAPKIRAMQIIDELETAPRGIYTGSLGWLAPDGDLRLNVAIRTLAIDAGGHASLGVGSGIVADSQAAAEWEECHLKARFLAGLETDVELIETWSCRDGVHQRLGAHLQRLRRSAAWFSYPFDGARLAAALADLPARGNWRVRIGLSRDGAISARWQELADEPPGVRGALRAGTPIDSSDPLRRHKTNVRAAYDAALAVIAPTPDIFDVVFCNERGEVAEGARSNVFVERDGTLLTPPLASGALPGILRADLLAHGRAREAVLFPADLADGFWLGNSLRGLVRVRLEE